MEYLQYTDNAIVENITDIRFKPYYKWNTFNTQELIQGLDRQVSVLNLIINGIPSILKSINVMTGIATEVF